MGRIHRDQPAIGPMAPIGCQRSRLQLISTAGATRDFSATMPTKARSPMAGHWRKVSCASTATRSFGTRPTVSIKKKKKKKSRSTSIPFLKEVATLRPRAVLQGAIEEFARSSPCVISQFVKLRLAGVERLAIGGCFLEARVASSRSARHHVSLKPRTWTSHSADPPRSSLGRIDRRSVHLARRDVSKGFDSILAFDWRHQHAAPDRGAQPQAAATCRKGEVKS